MKTYRIKYICYLKSRTLWDKEILVKNKENEMFAKAALEDYLKRKNPDFIRLVINECKQDFPDFGDIFGGAFNIFNS